MESIDRAGRQPLIRTTIRFDRPTRAVDNQGVGIGRPGRPGGPPGLSKPAAAGSSEVAPVSVPSFLNTQLLPRGIRDPLVLGAMRAVPRQLFVPDPLKANAYDDNPLPIGHDQTISQPYIVAFMTEALKLSGGERVLEIGTGSGYQAAVLAEIVEQVFTIEIVPQLAQQAMERLKAMHYDKVKVLVGDGYRGWPEEAPFDAIIVTAAPDHVPEALIEQLRPGGRMIVPVGGANQELILITRTETGSTRTPLLPVRFVPMTGEARLA